MTTGFVPGLDNVFLCSQELTLWLIKFGINGISNLVPYLKLYRECDL